MPLETGDVDQKFDKNLNSSLGLAIADFSNNRL